MIRGTIPTACDMDLAFDKEKTWFITHVEEVSGLFYIQLTDSSISVKYERLFQEIEGAISTGKIRNFETLPRIGDVCLAQFSEDQVWYRAQILSVDAETEEVEVYFIDYGNGETMTWRSMKVIPEEFCELPAQALQCRLADIEPVGRVWSNEAVDVLKELILDRELKGIPSHLCKTGAVVIKLFVDDDDSVLVAQQLVVAGYAHWKKSKSSQSSSSASVSSSSSSSLSVKVKPGQFGEIKVKINRYLDICISHLENPNNFYCQPIEHSNELTSMLEEMQVFYNSNQAVDLAAPYANQGQMCCARFSEDQFWYRGVIREICENSKFEVQFIDYGNSEILPLDEIKILGPKFLQLPALGLKSCLYGIAGTDGNASFSSESTGKFGDLTNDKQLVGHVKEICPNGQIKIVLFDTTGQDELNVNNELVRCGLAVSLHPTNGQSTKTDKSSYSLGTMETTVLHRYVALTIEIGVTELSYVTYSTDMFDFQCQLAKNSNSLENMMHELNDEYCKLKPGENKLQSFQTGTPCCAMYVEDGRFYRAEITSTANSKAMVSYCNHVFTDRFIYARVEFM